ncbi:MAG TPA: hypothetical protein VM432_04455 [Bdellovibrionales bacterium]|nr:hypothetical protein [Bdellovibrionales bacterium]
MRLILLLCMTLGFEFAYALPTAEVRCEKQDCLKYGWSTRIPRQARSTFTECIDLDCAKNGWRTHDRGAVLDVFCIGEGCFVDGWREIASVGGYSNLYECNSDVDSEDAAPDCMKYGWTGRGPASRERTECLGDGCKTNGWVTRLPYGRQARSICRVGYDEKKKQNISDCFRFGWDQFD